MFRKGHQHGSYALTTKGNASIVHQQQHKVTVLMVVHNPVSEALSD